LDRRLGAPQNRSGRCGEEKHLAPAGNPTPVVQPVARRDATDTGVIRMECTPLHIYFSLEFLSLNASFMHARSQQLEYTPILSFLCPGCISASRPGRFTIGENASCTHRIGGSVGPRPSLGIVEKRNICPCRESNPGRPARSPSRRHGHRSDIFIHRKSFNFVLE
jgi:hypothetical protein